MSLIGNSTLEEVLSRCNPQLDSLTGMWYHLALFYTEQEIGPAYTIIATATSLSGVAGGPLAAELLELDGRLGLQGWQVSAAHKALTLCRL